MHAVGDEATVVDLVLGLNRISTFASWPSGSTPGLTGVVLVHLQALP